MRNPPAYRLGQEQQVRVPVLSGKAQCGDPFSAASGTSWGNIRSARGPAREVHHDTDVLPVHDRQKSFRGGMELHLLADPDSVYRLRSARELGVNVNHRIT